MLCQHTPCCCHDLVSAHAQCVVADICTRNMHVCTVCPVGLGAGQELHADRPLGLHSCAGGGRHHHQLLPPRPACQDICLVSAAGTHALQGCAKCKHVSSFDIAMQAFEPDWVKSVFLSAQQPCAEVSCQSAKGVESHNTVYDCLLEGTAVTGKGCLCVFAACPGALSRLLSLSSSTRRH